jgi:hypothetical protein
MGEQREAENKANFKEHYKKRKESKASDNLQISVRIGRVRSIVRRSGTGPAGSEPFLTHERG